MKSKSLLVFSFLLMPLWLFAQQRITVSGVVTEQATGEPAIGVSILVKGTTNGTVTVRTRYPTFRLRQRWSSVISV